MSSLYRPMYTSFRMPDGAYRVAGKRVTSSTPGAVRVEAESPCWWGRWTDGNGKEHQRKLSKSKDTARRMLAKLAGDAQLASVGISDPFAQHRERPLLEHLEDYYRALSARGDTDEHVRRVRARCRVVLAGVEADTLGDLQPSAVLEFLAGLRVATDATLPEGKEWFKKAEVVAAVGMHRGSLARSLSRYNLQGQGNGRARRYPQAVVETLLERFCRGAGVATTNHHLIAIKGFTRWLVRDRRAPFDPLACLSAQNAQADVRVQRRALTVEEFARLLAAARRGQPFRGLSGADRAVLYLLAARSGLRASELASLAPASFDFAGRTVTVEACYSKHRRKDVQPLTAAVVAELLAFSAGKPRAVVVWPGPWHELGADMIRRDLEQAGIPFVDDQGCVYDFHALRHQFISDMVESGVHPKDAQALARHSSITLTMDRYAHVRPANLRAALDRLPDLSNQPAAPRRAE